MAGQSLPRTTTGNAAEDTRFLELVDTLRLPMGCPLLLGRLVTVELPAAGSVTFNHLLARQPVGLLVVDQTTAPPLYERTAWNSRTITLSSFVACTVTFWIF